MRPHRTEWKIAGIATFVALVVAFIVAFAFKLDRGSNACRGIGAELVDNGHFSACVKPDGSLWRVPQ